MVVPYSPRIEYQPARLRVTFWLPSSSGCPPGPCTRPSTGSLRTSLSRQRLLARGCLMPARSIDRDFADESRTTVTALNTQLLWTRNPHSSPKSQSAARQRRRHFSPNAGGRLGGRVEVGREQAIGTGVECLFMNAGAQLGARG